MAEKIRLSKLAFPLRTIRVGRASALSLQFENTPDEVEAIQLHIGNSNNSETVHIDAYFSPGGVAKCYCPGVVFPDAGEARYHVTAKSTYGDSVYLGWGKLIIVPSVLQRASDANTMTGIPEDTYLRGTDGLFYKLSVEIDEETGKPTVSLADEGITR